MQKQSPQWQETARSYFIFSRSQRRALAICILLILACSGWQVYKMYQISQSQANVPFVAVKVRSELVALDTSSFNNNSYPKNSNSRYANNNYANNNYGQSTSKNGMDGSKLHPFDPNTASEAELQDLGLRPGLIKTLLNYRSKGGKFRKPEDLAKLYGIRQEESAQLISYVEIENEPYFSANENTGQPSENAYLSSNPKARNSIPVVDINLVDSFSLRMLPSIGAKRAATIIRYRDNLGGFIHTDQLKEVYGINDSVFNAIIPYIQLNKDAIARINLNTATEAQIKKHPYIGYKLAGIIISYRNQHGSYKSVDDLLKIYIIKPDWLEKVKPYLVVDL